MTIATIFLVVRYVYLEQLETVAMLWTLNVPLSARMTLEKSYNQVQS
jgi:hypothetical protein